MTTPARTIKASEPLSAAARLLAKERVRRLFVTDDLGRLVGVVSQRDRRRRADAIVSAVRALPGVVGVRNGLRYLVDDVVVAGSGGWTGFSP